MSDATTPEPQCPPVPDALMDIIHSRFHTRREAAQRGANWGFTQALAAAQRLAAEERQKGADAWPEPITDRAPTEADADDGGLVQCQANGCWYARLWEVAAHDSAPWHHTPRWRPPAPTKREQALALIPPVGTQTGTLPLTPAELAIVRQALEEAGDER